MKRQLFFRVIFSLVLLLAILAPFTFLVPNSLVPLTELKLSAASLPVLKRVPVVTIEKPKSKPKSVEQPLHGLDLPDFAAISDVPTKKSHFFAFIRPAIDAKNMQLTEQRTKLESWHEQISLGLGLGVEEQVALKILTDSYRVNEESSALQQINELMMRVDIIPTPLVLVQAANESAWGTSRFARIGLNFFGIWCYRTGCGMVPGGRNVGAKHEVAAFQSVDAAVSGYFNNINKHNAYHLFRTIRAELRAKDEPLDATILAAGLLPYSERGAKYVLDITNMLRYNQNYFIEKHQVEQSAIH